MCLSLNVRAAISMLYMLSRNHDRAEFRMKYCELFVSSVAKHEFMCNSIVMSHCVCDFFFLSISVNCQHIVLHTAVMQRARYRIHGHGQ